MYTYFDVDRKFQFTPAYFLFIALWGHILIESPSKKGKLMQNTIYNGLSINLFQNSERKREEREREAQLVFMIEIREFNRNKTIQKIHFKFFLTCRLLNICIFSHFQPLNLLSLFLMSFFSLEFIHFFIHPPPLISGIRHPALYHTQMRITYKNY